jgi:hypothetical protein
MIGGFLMITVRDSRGRQLPKQLDEARIIELFNSGLTHQEIADSIGEYKQIVTRTVNRLGLIRPRIRSKRFGESNHKWKGDSAKYGSLHNRLRTRFGTPQQCECCETECKSVIYDWANLTGNYQDIGDYKRLCRTCHNQFDSAKSIARKTGQLVTFDEWKSLRTRKQIQTDCLQD